MNPISLVHLRKLLLPSSRSHRSATEPRSKTQPTATAHTQRKHTRHGCWQPKPVRPSLLTYGFGRGIKGKRTMKGSHEFPPSNPQEQGAENTPRKPPREGSENHHQEQPGTTQQSLEEPCRIIYTYQGGSYKV
jgi:hypothetical protein